MDFAEKKRKQSLIIHRTFEEQDEKSKISVKTLPLSWIILRKMEEER